ncbi:MAG: hydroxyacid dehydrogenase, partial [Anaerolineae bacterium]
MKLAVHLHHPSREEAALSLLRDRLAPEISLTIGPGLPRRAAYDILVAGRPRQEHLTASPQLRAVVVPWAGIPESTRDLMQ